MCHYYALFKSGVVYLSSITNWSAVSAFNPSMAHTTPGRNKLRHVLVMSLTNRVQKSGSKASAMNIAADFESGHPFQGGYITAIGTALEAGGFLHRVGCHMTTWKCQQDA